MVDLEQHLNILSVLGELLGHYGKRRNLKLQVADAGEMRVHFKVMKATRPIFSAKKEADSAAIAISSRWEKGHPAQGNSPENHGDSGQHPWPRQRRRERYLRP